MAVAPSVDQVGVLDKKPEKKHKYDHPAGDIQYGSIRQFFRMISVIIYFGGSILVLFTTQLLGSPLYFISKPAYYAWMARTKAHFGVLVTTLTQWWSPTVIRVTGDKTVRDQIRVTADGKLECDFPERMILIANHQLYSDWLYLWWIAYTAKMHGFLYIILKESLKYIPVVGQGMLFYGFIFLARKWEQDKPRFMHRLSKLSAKGTEEPMWLLIFPEGTNASENGRKTSKKYAERIGVEDHKHVLLPRTTGLAFCIQNLRKSVEWMYDCTMAYEGIPEGKFGQDYFTLYSTYFEGRPPKSVNLHFRRFRLADIPVDEPEKFELWLRERWVEKDHLLEYYVQNGRFPEDEDEPLMNGSNGSLTGGGDLRRRNDKSHGQVNGVVKSKKMKEWDGIVETEVLVRSRREVFDIYSTLLTAGLLVHIIRTIWNLVFKITTETALGTPAPSEILASI